MAKGIRDLFGKVRKIGFRKPSGKNTNLGPEKSRLSVPAKEPVYAAKPQARTMQHPISFLALKRKLGPRIYSFEEANGWLFQSGYRTRSPVLVLRDRRKHPHFIMEYERKECGNKPILYVRRIIRNREKEDAHSFLLGQEKLERSLQRKRETATRIAKEFQAELGMFPSEFLSSEFIFRHRDEIGGGVKVIIDLNTIPREHIRNYKPLLARLFKKSTSPELRKQFIVPYELDIGKRRVQEILRDRTRLVREG